MYDSFNRNINYLRISVTDRCNLRCVYCMPEEGIKLLNHDDILRYEEIVEVVQVAVNLGITKVRITGGEPLVRKGITELVGMIAGIRGISDLGLTTNGILLEHFAVPLARAGLHRINVSLDSMDSKKFRQLTRGGDLQMVLNGIIAAKKAGLSPIRINCVVKESSEEPDAIVVKEFSEKNGLEARFIHKMDLDSGSFSIVENGHGGDCRNCNRLRLTANGKIRPCLFSDLEFDTREMGIRQALVAATGAKPEKGTINSKDTFNFMGG